MDDLKIAADNDVKFVRVGQNADDIDTVKDYVIEAKNLGWKLWLII